MNRAHGVSWESLPERHPDAFILRRRSECRVLTAVCEVWSHPEGWELRLQVEGRGLQTSAVVGTVTDVMAAADRWRESLVERGWQ
jgi:hypothetical protein